MCVCVSPQSPPAPLLPCRACLAPLQPCDPCFTCCRLDSQEHPYRMALGVSPCRRKSKEGQGGREAWREMPNFNSGPESVLAPHPLPCREPWSQNTLRGVPTLGLTLIVGRGLPQVDHDLGAGRSPRQLSNKAFPEGDPSVGSPCPPHPYCLCSATLLSHLPSCPPQHVLLVLCRWTRCSLPSPLM